MNGPGTRRNVSREWRDKETTFMRSLFQSKAMIGVAAERRV